MSFNLEQEAPRRLIKMTEVLNLMVDLNICFQCYLIVLCTHENHKTNVIVFHQIILFVNTLTEIITQQMNIYCR